jgi:phenylacetate-coenzyme A ligase PaaK-like adenylate-forming protein
MEIDEILNTPPYSLNKENKHQMLNKVLSDLTLYHYAHCMLYKKMLDAIGYRPTEINDYDYLPFLPVRLFKMMELRSVGLDDIVKTMTSSGTTGQSLSKIFLDKNTSAYQTKALIKIVSTFISNQRLPMIILDSREAVKDREMFSARGAGILGFSIFGNKKIYAFNEKMELNRDVIEEFIKNHKREKIFLFGFTFIIWQHFYKELLKSNKSLNLSNAVLIHGGGWKKLISESVTSKEFKDSLKSVCGIDDIHDYYGMAEQTGSIYMECEYGHLHASVFSDVIIRKPIDFSIAEKGEKGIIQVLSILPHSYPGHNLLTEDEGILLGEDDCPCGRLGRYFKIEGRIKDAEIRGCSDVYAN